MLLTLIDVAASLVIVLLVVLVFIGLRIARELGHVHDWLEVVAEGQKKQTELLQAIERRGTK